MSEEIDISDTTDTTTTRRSVLKSGLTASALLAGVPTLATSAASENESATTSTNQAMICDVDMDYTFAVELVPTADPESNNKDRGTVVHATSSGAETTDYVCSTVDVRAQELTIGDVRKGRQLTYDYLVGDDSENATPDEVFLTLRADDSIYVAYQTASENRPTGKWFTRNVSAELNGKGRGWHVIEIDPKLIDTENELAPTTNEIIVDAIVSLRESETVNSLVKEFSRETEVLAVSIGTGWTTQETVVDVYFDNLVVGDETYEIPAVVTLDVAFYSVNEDTAAFNARLQPSEESDLSVEQIDASSAVLSAYAPIAPPVPGTDVTQSALAAEDSGTGSISASGVGAYFSRRLAEENFGAGTLVLLVTGDLTLDHPTSFVATAELTFEDLS